jgi:type IV secretory pathway VirB10-like protein
MGKWIIGAIVVIAIISGGSSSEDATKKSADLPEVVEAVTGTDEAAAAEQAEARAARRAEARREVRREARAEARREARAAARREARREARAEQERVQALAVAAETSECDENYSGCLDPNSSDYDCEGGSGDGPDYTGLVNVRGSDTHDLDRDGDGIACDTY